MRTALCTINLFSFLKTTYTITNGRSNILNGTSQVKTAPVAALIKIIQATYQFCITDIFSGVTLNHARSYKSYAKGEALR